MQLTLKNISLCSVLIVVLSAISIAVSEDNLQQKPVDVTILILNQHHRLHERKAHELQKNIAKEATLIPQLLVSVEIGSLSFPHLPYWTFFPLLEQFQKTESDWFLFVDEFCTVNLKNLYTLITEQCNASYIGRSLSDSEPSAIHHYASPSVVPRYPDTRAGLLLAGHVLRSAADILVSSSPLANNFVIDPSYEFSAWLYKSVGQPLRDTTRLCISEQDEDDAEGCAVVARAPYVCHLSPLKTSTLHVAVKTYSGHHNTRLPVLRQTWLQPGLSYTLYSDVTDRTHGTVWSGVNNTERGHCAKTLAILERALDLPPQWQWLLVADDDTLVSIPRLSSVLSCYSPSEKLALGEVYGFRAAPQQPLLPYPTGGSGMIFSRPMVEDVTSSSRCRCRAADEPDDMLLGACLGRLGHHPLHLRDMHQNTPPSYSAGRLYGSRPLSFHGFWQIDPVHEYEQWLLEDTAPARRQTAAWVKRDAAVDKVPGDIAEDAHQHGEL